MPFRDESLFYTYKAGRLTIVGFDGRQIIQDQPEECLNALLALVKHHECEILVVDLMDVPILSSWVLGVLVTIQKNGIRVELYHPSAAMKEVLAVTNLDDLLHVRDEL